MNRRLSRRQLLRAGATAAAMPAAASWGACFLLAQPKPEPGAEQLTAYQDGPQIWVRWNNLLLTSYRAHPTQKYPYLYPLAGPLSGLSLTSETSVPYPHHRSLLFACDRVNGANYWQGPLAGGQIVSAGPRLGRVTAQSAEILDECQWRVPGKEPAMADTRKFTVQVVGPRLRWIDAEITWTALQNVKVEKTNHSLFALRASPDIIPWSGGTLVNSAGQVGEKATFGQKAAWCAYWGKRQGLAGSPVEGIALFDHPANPWAPSPWFTRDYGFISPTPMNFLDKPWELGESQSVSLRYRVVVFGGDPKEAELDRLYKQWAG